LIERYSRPGEPIIRRDLLLFDLDYRHGLRRSEAGLLKVDHMRHGKVWIARRKHGLVGSYPLHPRSKELLALYLRERPDGSPYLLRSRRHSDRPLSGGEINRLFHSYATAADLPFDRRHVHVLRHSIGVHLANAKLGCCRCAGLAGPSRHLLNAHLLPDHEQTAGGEVSLCAAVARDRTDERRLMAAANARFSANSSIPCRE